MVKKVIATVLIIIVLACGFSACDKNEPDEYINFIIDTSDIYFDAGDTTKFPIVYVQTYDAASKTKSTPKLLTLQQVKGYLDVIYDDEKLFWDMDGNMWDRDTSKKEEEFFVELNIKSV